MSGLHQKGPAVNHKKVKAHTLRTGQIIVPASPLLPMGTITTTAKWNHHKQIMVTTIDHNGKEHKQKFCFDDDVIVLS